MVVFSRDTQVAGIVELEEARFDFYGEFDGLGEVLFARISLVGFECVLPDQTPLALAQRFVDCIESICFAYKTPRINFKIENKTALRVTERSITLKVETASPFDWNVYRIARDLWKERRRVDK